MADPYARAREILQASYRSVHREQQLREKQQWTFADYLREAGEVTQQKLEQVDVVPNRLQALIEELKRAPPDAPPFEAENNIFSGILDEDQ